MPDTPPVGRILPLLILAALGAPPASSSATEPPESGFPGLETADVVLIGSSLALAGLGRWGLDTDVRSVPGTGFDRANIEPAWDRRSIRPPDRDAARLSEVLLVGTAVWPAATTWLATPGWDGTAQIRGRRIQFESMLAAYGVSLVVKKLVSRARPFTYLDETARDAGPDYDADDEDAFLSFPSGHAVLAWSSVTAGTALLAAQRPDLPAGIHFAAGAVGGVLATSASLLRLEAGRHFPSDVAAGAALGASAGAAVPLLRLDTGGEGFWRSWRAGLAGMAAGAVITGLLAPPTSPWID